MVGQEDEEVMVGRKRGVMVGEEVCERNASSDLEILIWLRYLTTPTQAQTINLATHCKSI